MGCNDVDLSGLGEDTAAGSCEHGNEPSGSIKLVKFIDQLDDYQFSRRTLLHGISSHKSQTGVPSVVGRALIFKK
jgi:hypothetical protein